MQHPLQGLLPLLQKMQPEQLQDIIHAPANIASIKSFIKEAVASTKINCCIFLSHARNKEHLYCMANSMLIMICEYQGRMRNYSENMRCNIDETDLMLDVYTTSIDALGELFTFIEYHFCRQHGNAVYKGSNSNNSFATGDATTAQLMTHLSVPQLALFMRLLVDAHILDEDINVSALVMHVAGVLRTKKASTISAESLRVKYYMPERAAINIMKEYLIRMMNLLKGY